MPADRDFVDHCTELLGPLGPVRVRRMFGGYGLYVADVFVAIIAFDRLYLKADAATREHFAQAGCEAFTYTARGRRVSLGYWSAPDAALESPAAMRPFAQLALEAALRARAGRPGAPVKRQAKPRAAPRGARTKP